MSKTIQEKLQVKAEFLRVHDLDKYYNAGAKDALDLVRKELKRLLEGGVTLTYRGIMELVKQLNTEKSVSKEKVKPKAKAEKNAIVKKEKANKCQSCKHPIAVGETFCGECLCEDDCGY